MNEVSERRDRVYMLVLSADEFLGVSATTRTGAFYYRKHANARTCKYYGFRMYIYSSVFYHDKISSGVLRQKRVHVIVKLSNQSFD